MSATQRVKTGCWTCRLRRKKCNEDGQPCSNCEARGVLCHGYGPKPPWKDRGEREREEARRLQLISRSRSRHEGIAGRPEDRRVSIDLSSSDSGSSIPVGRSSSISTTFEPLDIPDLPPSLWDQALDLIPLGDTSFVRLSSSLTEPSPPASLQFPSVMGNGMEESEIELVMYYLEEAFPKQHSAYRSTSLTDRAWLLCLLKRSCSFYYTSLGLSAYYRLLDIPEDGYVRSTLMKEYERYKVSSMCQFQDLLNSAQTQPSFSASAMLGECIICGVQIAMLEAMSKNMQSAYMHLKSAALSLAQNLEKGLLDTLTRQAPSLTTSASHVQTMDGKALRFFSAVLVWNDVLHCSTQLVTPAAADTYRTLLTDENFVQLFPAAVGCEGWVLLPILEAIFLATWKKDQEIQGQLSLRELIVRVDRIESVLHQRLERLTPKIVNHNNNNPSTRTSTSTSTSNVEHNISQPRPSPEQIKFIQTYIFAHASFVHLHTVVSGCKPSVPEIQQNIEKSIAAWRLLPPAAINFQTMAWPFLVCGSLAVGAQRETFQTIMAEGFQGHATLGNLPCLRSVVQECWTNFDRRGAAQEASGYNWKVVMERLNLSLLFI